MKFMPYADDTIWLLFGLGIAIILGTVVAYLALGIFGWGSVGLIGTGLLVSSSYYVVGTRPPRDQGVGT
jgi:hypothetical protein